MAPVWKPASRTLLDVSDNQVILHSQLGKVGLRGEALDRLDEVLVRGVVAGDHLADDGDDLERVLAVDPEMLVTVIILEAYSLRRGFETLPNSRTPMRPPGLRTRYASLRTAGSEVQLRMPKAMV